MLKNLKRLLSLILILALLVPNMAFADGLNGKSKFVEQPKTKEIIKDEILKEIQNLLKKENLTEDLVEDYDTDEAIRIIVELNEKPVIVHANESGQKYEDMSYTQKSSIEDNIYLAQEAVKNQISAKNIEMTFSRSFNTVFSGFSGEVKFEDIEIIEDIKGVKKVYISNEYERPRIEPNMGSSNDMIGSKELWDEKIGYKGEGMVVSIIDTGVDPDHKDFKLTDEDRGRIKEGDIVEPLLGKYFTPKVPYGYNYYDLNNTILDLGPSASEHGMHVAGTVTANGEIKGVAPESQVLAMKVFSNDPIYATTFDDIYLVAIEESIKLKVDVINMSLGSTASFYVANSAMDVAITNATEAGVVCSISAGNSGHTQYGWDENSGLPFKQDPDYGLVGAPSLSKDSISVASIENENISASYLEYDVSGVAEVLPNFSFIIKDEAFHMDLLDDKDVRKKLIDALNNRITVYIKRNNTRFTDENGKDIGDLSALPKSVTYMDRYSNLTPMAVREGNATGPGKTVQAPMANAGSVALSDAFKDPVEFVDCGIGEPEDFVDKNMTGKIALIIRGGFPFTEKIENAEVAGAAGVIVYNNEDGGDELINMQYPPGGKIPAGFIGHTFGSELMELKDKFVKFPSGVISTPNTNRGKMSEFTSWGTTPTLELKPEITAPGGQIYSTLQKDKYGIMSGTSMAAPHLSGGSALVMQYIKDEGLATGLDKQTKLAKVFLMNTAGIVIEDEEAPYSPRLQGAGLMNLKAAVTTPVRLVNSNGEAKVELKDFDSTTFTMELIAINHSKEELTYNISTDVLADYIDKSGFNTLSSRIVDAKVTYSDDQITIPAEGEKAFTVTVDISEDRDIYKNMFVDGFIKLTDSTDSQPDLSVPFVGFYGNWDEPRILDAMRNEEDSYYGFTGMVNTKASFYGETIAISPDTEDGEKFQTNTITPILSLLRNAERVEYNILDNDNNKLRTIRTENFVRKNYIDGSRKRPPYSYIKSRVWDGKVKDKVVEDGLYQYQIRAKIQNGEWQERLVPVFVDTIAPEITDLSYDKETGKLSWKATDATTSIEQILVLINDKIVETIEIEKEQVEFEQDIKAVMDELLKVDGDNIIEIVAVDIAMNTSKASITVSNDTEVPYIYLLEPELLEFYNTKDIEFKGYVLKGNKIKSVKINNEEATVTFDKAIKHLEGTPDEVIVPGYRFNHTLNNLENGMHTIRIEAESLGGTKIDVVRRFFVDIQKPELTVKVKSRDEFSDTAELDITMKDNFSYLGLYVFDSEEYNEDMAPTNYDSVKPSSKNLQVKVDLDLGENLIPVKLIDIAGNESTEIVKITREEPTLDKSVELDKKALEIKYAKGDSSTNVTQDLILSSVGKYGSTITWTSNNKSVISNDGKVTKPLEDTIVTLIATIKKGDVTDTKEFKVTVVMDESAKNPLVGKVKVGYGEFPVGSSDKQYISYVLFSLKDEFKDGTIAVKVNNESLEKKEGKDGFDFRFEGMLSAKPTEVVIIINGKSYDVSEGSEFTPIAEQKLMMLLRP